VTLGSYGRFVVLLSLSLLPVRSGAAIDEQVCIRKVVGNKAILLRGEQDFYLVQTSAACLSLAQQEGRMVVVRSPDGFPGPGSDLMLDGQKQPCPIARAAALFSNVAAVDAALGTGRLAIYQPQVLIMLQEALMLLGHDPGTVGSKADTIKVVNELRTENGNEATTEGLKKTVVLMALQVVSRNPNNDRAREVSRRLLNLALGPDASKIHP
jgi:hypothetical protein